MKRVLSIILCIMMLGAVSALTFSATAAEADDAVVAATEEITVIGDGTETEAPATEAEVPTEAIATEAEQATEAETTAETTAVTEAATQAATTAPTQAATVAATQPAKNANTPKTGDNLWLYIGIGVVVVAIIVIIITVVAKKKKDNVQ